MHDRVEPSTAVAEQCARGDVSVELVVEQVALLGQQNVFRRKLGIAFFKSLEM
jgi:hypothetical protein